MKRGFTLIELMIVVAIIAIIAAIAIPGLLSARLGANESSAIGTLKSIVSSQETFRTQAVNDADGDGEGEYGFLSQLAGASPTIVNQNGNAALHAGGGLLAQGRATFLSPQFGVNAGGMISKSGYAIDFFLPIATGAGAALLEPAAPIAAVPATDPDNSETRWACYAFPVTAGQTGKRAFITNQSGEIAQTQNDTIGTLVGTFFYSENGGATNTAALALAPGLAYAITAPNVGINLEGAIGITINPGVTNSTDGQAWMPSK